MHKSWESPWHRSKVPCCFEPVGSFGILTQGDECNYKMAATGGRANQPSTKWQLQEEKQNQKNIRKLGHA